MLRPLLLTKEHIEAKATIMDTAELYAKLDNETILHFTLYDESNDELASYFSTSKVLYTNLSDTETTFASFVELIEHLKENFSSVSKRFTIELAIKNSGVDARIDSSDAIAHFSRWGHNPEPIEIPKKVIVSLSELLAETLKMDLAGPILSITKIIEG